MNPQETSVVENKEIVQTQTEAHPVQEQVDTPEQINWKKFREAREIERKQREAAEKQAKEKAEEAAALKAAMEAILNKQPVHQTRNDYEEVETEDQRIDKKVKAAIEMEKRKLDEERRQRDVQELPQRLSSTYSDFNQVCNTDNLDYLEYHFPEIAAPFKYMPDGFDKWSSVYKAVKRLVPNPDSKKEQKKAEKNFNKPQSMAVAGATQTGDSAPIQLDDKRRAANWERMQKVMKGGR